MDDTVRIARQLYAMTKGRKSSPTRKMLNNEHYQRTFTDEYPWCKPARPGFKPVDPEQKAQWQAAAKRGS
jgi:hypothetical protein